MLTEEQAEKMIAACIQAMLTQFRPNEPDDAFHLMAKIISTAANLAAAIVKDTPRTLDLLDQIRAYVASGEVKFEVRVIDASALHPASEQKH